MSKLDKCFSEFIRKKHKLTDLGENYFKHNFAEEYLIFSEGFNLMKKDAEEKQEQIDYLNSKLKSFDFDYYKGENVSVNASTANALMLQDRISALEIDIFLLKDELKLACNSLEKANLLENEVRLIKGWWGI